MIDLLVITHEATRSGSPIALLQLLRNLAANSSIRFSVRPLAGGPLVGEFAMVSTATDTGSTPRAILVNGSTAAGELLDPSLQVPSAVYVHEDEEALTLLTAEAREGILSASVVFGVSERAGRDLERIGVDPSRVVILPPVIRSAHPPTDEEVMRARTQLGLEPGQRLILGCGEAVWHKGADLFVDVARMLASRDELTFAWVGRRPRSFGRQLDVDTRLAGIGDNMSWLGEVDDPSTLMAVADVLVMPSRRDAQPMVPLEAALVGTPTAGFEVGGLADLAALGAAVTVPYPDTRELADAISSLLESPGAIAALVSRGRRLISEERTIEILGSRFLNFISALLNEAGSPIGDSARGNGNP